MISGKDQHIIRIVVLHVFQILEYGICSSSVPFTVVASLIWWKDCYTTNISVQVPRYTNSNMCIQFKRLILCQYTYCIDAGIDTVAQREIYDSVFSPEGDCRFSHLGCQNTQS